MNIDKAKKRIAKRVKMGFQGYPILTISYQMDDKNITNTVMLSLVLEEGAEEQKQPFSSKDNVHEDESVQSAIVKMIERCEVKTVFEKNDSK